MRILIYLAHPAQFHFFKNIMKQLRDHGHQIKLLIKTKDILETLVREEGLDYENMLPEPRGTSTFSIIGSMFLRDFRMMKAVRQFKPDLLMGSDSSVAHTGFLTGRKSITFGEDDYRVIRRLAWMLIPFSSCYVSPQACSAGPFRYKKIPYKGYMKLAYLHPSLFLPDPVKISGLSGQNRYCLIRLTRLSAHHDKQVSGLNDLLVKEIISKTERYGVDILLDSENTLPPELEKYRLSIPKNDIHHVMAFASLIISDSQSMSMEAAMLGVPNIRYNDFAGRISVLEELEKQYGLTCGIRPPQSGLLFEKVDHLLTSPGVKAEFQEKRLKMLADKINVPDFMVWFIENFPESRKIIKENPAYQSNFR